MSRTDKRTDGIAIAVSSVAEVTACVELPWLSSIWVKQISSSSYAESCFKNIMHLRDSGCARTLRPLFVYATESVCPSSLSIVTKIDDLGWSWTAISSNFRRISEIREATTAKRMKIDRIVCGMSLSWAYLHSYSHFASKNCKIVWNSPKIRTYAVQGHQSWCQSEAHSLIVTLQFVRISYCLQDIDA